MVSEGAVAKLESEIEGVPASSWVRDEPPDNSLSAISGQHPLPSSNPPKPSSIQDKTKSDNSFFF